MMEAISTLAIIAESPISKSFHAIVDLWNEGYWWVAIPLALLVGYALKKSMDSFK